MTKSWQRRTAFGLFAALAVAALACSDRKVETGKRRSAEPVVVPPRGDAAAVPEEHDASASVTAETAAAVAALDGLVEARVYFEARRGAVAQGVLAYFRALNQRSGNLQLREVSPDDDPHAARAAAGPDKRMVAIDYAGRRRAVGLTVRGGQVVLSDLDTVVRAAVLRLAPKKSVGNLYRTVGHGELRAEGGKQAAERNWAGFRRVLEQIGYGLRDLGPTVLRRGVPADASAVVVLGPTARLDGKERAALEAYVAGGGALLVALDLDGGERLGSLAAYFGIRFEPVVLADDEHKIRAEGGPSHPTTRAFADHPAVAAAARGSVWIPLFRSGVLWDAVERGRAMDATRTRIVQTSASAFIDRNGNGEQDGGTEKRGAYTVALALESKKGGRAVVFADAQLFSSPVLTRFRGAQIVCAEVVRWLLRQDEAKPAQ